MRWHRRQEFAFQCADECPHVIRVYCAQRHHEDTRVFLTADDSEFVGWYYTLPPELRNLYEVIRVDTPCRLYLDVEYNLDLNRALSEDTVMSTLKMVFVEAINKLIPGVNITQCDIVDLVATTARKMSHHLIFHTNDVAFANNAACGALVGLVAEKLQAYVNDGRECVIFNHNTFTRTELAGLFVNASTGKQFVVDQAVYTANRQFRILDSAKRLKNNHLIVAADNCYPLSVDPWTRLEATLVSCPFSWRRLVLPVDFGVATVAQVPRHWPVNQAQGGGAVGLNTPLTNFVQQYVDSFTRQARVSDCARMPNGRVFRIHVKGEQWCGNIGRPHRSNRVYYIVSFYDNTLTQRCLDPDCTGYCSPPVNVDPNLMPK